MQGPSQHHQDVGIGRARQRGTMARAGGQPAAHPAHPAARCGQVSSAAGDNSPRMVPAARMSRPCTPLRAERKEGLIAPGPHRPSLPKHMVGARMSKSFTCSVLSHHHAAPRCHAWGQPTQCIPDAGSAACQSTEQGLTLSSGRAAEPESRAPSAGREQPQGSGELK